MHRMGETVSEQLHIEVKGNRRAITTAALD